MTELVNPRDERSTFSYDALGRIVQRKLGNDNLTTQVYDSAARMTDGGLLGSERT